MLNIYSEKEGVSATIESYLSNPIPIITKLKFLGKRLSTSMCRQAGNSYKSSKA